MRVTTRVLFCTLWFLISVALSNLAFAQADDVSGETHRRIEYMMLPQGEAPAASFDSAQAFRADGKLEGQRLTPERDVTIRVRLYPASRDGWKLSDCIVRIDPGFMTYLVRWGYPVRPDLGLERDRGVDPAIFGQGICHSWSSDIEYFEFYLELRSGLSFEIGYPPPEDLLLGNVDERGMVLLLGLAGFAALFSLSLAFFLGSVRIVLQCVATCLLLILIAMRFGGAGGLHFFSSEVMATYTIPGRLFSLYSLLFFASVLWEVKFKLRNLVYLIAILASGILIILPTETLRLIHPNPFIFIGGLPLLVGLILNLYLLVFIRGETLLQVIRGLRILILCLLFASLGTVTGRLELPGLVTYWQLGVVFETLITLGLGLKEQRRFVELGRSLEEASSELETRKEGVRAELNRVEKSHQELLQENAIIDEQNRELKRAVDEVSSVERVMSQKRERLHFSELLGFRLAGLGHDLMNPLGLARGIMDLLPSSKWSEDELQTKDEFIDEIDKMTMLRTAVRIFGRPEVIEKGPTNRPTRVFEVEKTITSGLELFQFSGTKSHIETEFSGSAVVEGAAGDLSRVVVELLSNAERASRRSEREQRIKVCLDVFEGQARISIHDSGDGFPEGGFAASTLGFMNLSDSPRPEQFHLGLGLLMSVRLISDLGGEISLRSTPSDFGGAVVDIDLPLANAVMTP